MEHTLLLLVVKRRVKGEPSASAEGLVASSGLQMSKVKLNQVTHRGDEKNLASLISIV